MPYQLRITLQDVTPPVWRRVIVPGALTLFDLHHVIQIAMGWDDCHLHDFTIRRKRYALPSDEDFDDPLDESTARLRDVIRPRHKFVYQYDFGDSWYHMIVVEEATDDDVTAAPRCVDGARACPPEDSGGPWGYIEKLQAVANPDDRETELLREWMGDFDPEEFDLNSVNSELRKWFQTARRNIGRSHSWSG